MIKQLWHLPGPLHFDCTSHFTPTSASQSQSTWAASWGWLFAYGAPPCGPLAQLASLFASLTVVFGFGGINLCADRRSSRGSEIEREEEWGREGERGSEVETAARPGHMIYSQTNYAKSARSHSLLSLSLSHDDFNLINVCAGMREIFLRYYRSRALTLNGL